MLNVYVDTGGMESVVTELELAGLIRTHYFPFEQRNKKVQNFVSGSGATWDQCNLSWDEEPGTWDDDKTSPLFEKILHIVGGYLVDAQHLDSAYKSGCTVFLTSDKTDIWSNRIAFQALLGVLVIHTRTEQAALRDLANASANIYIAVDPVKTTATKIHAKNVSE